MFESKPSFLNLLNENKNLFLEFVFFLVFVLVSFIKKHLLHGKQPNHDENITYINSIQTKVIIN